MAEVGSRNKESALFGFLIVLVAAGLTFVLLQGGLLEPSYSHVKRAVSAELRDPANAQFRRIRGSNETYCGEVNARNALGVDSGFRPFIYRRGIVVFEPRKPIGASIAQLADHYEDIAQYLRLSREC